MHKLKKYAHNVDSPLRKYASFDVVVQLPGTIVGVFTSQFSRHSVSEGLQNQRSLVGFESPEGRAYLDLSGRELDVDLDIRIGAILLTPLEGGSTEAMLSVEAIRSPTIGKEYHDLVNRFRVLREKILPNALEIDFW